MKNDPKCQWCAGEKGECVCNVSASETLKNEILASLNLLPTSDPQNSEPEYHEKLLKIGKWAYDRGFSGPDLLYALSLHHCSLEETKETVGLAHILKVAAENLQMIGARAENFGEELISRAEKGSKC